MSYIQRNPKIFTWKHQKKKTNTNKSILDIFDSKLVSFERFVAYFVNSFSSRPWEEILQSRLDQSAYYDQLVISAHCV